MIRPRFRPVVLIAVTIFGFCIPALAETKWSRFPSGLNICPSPENVNDSGCPRSKMGPITVLRPLQDRIGRTVYEVAYSGGSGFISDYQYQYDMIDEDPAITKQKARDRASKAATAAAVAKATAAEKAKKQNEQDALVIAAMPRADLEKGCILAAAERLPRIPGIQITSSKTSDLPPEHKPADGTYMTIVEIGAKAAGQDVTYSYICAKGARTPTLITPFAQR